MAKRVLGKGLGAIIANTSSPSEEVEKTIVDDSNRIVEVNLDKILPNPDQPREHFDEEEIEGLADSIRSVGLIQPIILRKEKDQYFIVAGERRYRAVKLLEKKAIRAIIIEANEEENLSLALIENIQRQNLDPIEEAKSYKLLISRFKLKQNDVAKKVGKQRATVANSLRLLNLPVHMQTALSTGVISSGHAKVLLSIEDLEKQERFYKETITRGLSVRALEKLVAEIADLESDDENSKRPKAKKEAHIKDMESKLVSLLGTKVEIKHAGKRGKIEISYYSLDDFERIIEKFS